MTAGRRHGKRRAYQVDGETVVEAIFGYSANIRRHVRRLTTGYAAGADRTVLFRWYTSQPDPVVKAGDWIADVTYERHHVVDHAVLGWRQTPDRTSRSASPTDQQREWDNLPAQRCYWYQVQKAPRPTRGRLDITSAATSLSLDGRLCQPVVAAADRVQRRRHAGGAQRGPDLPSVVNVIPPTIFTR